MSNCVRCGAETAKGIYCARCRGWAEKVKSLMDTAESDAELLAMASGMTKAEIARRLGVSRAAVGQRLQRARMRQVERALIGP